MELVGGERQVVQRKLVVKADLTNECWLIQFWGFEECISCNLLDTSECGGQEIRKTGKNSKGIKIPLEDIRTGRADLN